MSNLAVFGEITSGVVDSKYSWANAVTMTLLSKLKDVEGFENVKESDIVNAGLVFLNLFFNLHIDVKCVEETEMTLCEMTFNEKEFKDFFNIAINHGKMHNIMLNDEIIFAFFKDGF